VEFVLEEQELLQIREVAA